MAQQIILYNSIKIRYGIYINIYIYVWAIGSGDDRDDTHSIARYIHTVHAYIHTYYYALVESLLRLVCGVEVRHLVTEQPPALVVDLRFYHAVPTYIHTYTHIHIYIHNDNPLNLQQFHFINSFSKFIHSH